MEHLWRKRSNIIILGDFNDNLSSSCDPSLKRKFTNLLCKFNLKKVIDVPTRITGDSSSLIDLIISSVPSKISGHGACNPGISDHHLVYATVNLRGISEKPKSRIVRDFKRVDIKLFNLNLLLFHGLSVITLMILMYIIDQHIPLRMAKVRSKSLPWMTSSLRKELNKRHNLLLKAQKTPRGSPEWLAYKKQINYCTKLLRSAEISY